MDVIDLEMLQRIEYFYKVFLFYTFHNFYKFLIDINKRPLILHANYSIIFILSYKKDVLYMQNTQHLFSFMNITFSINISTRGLSFYSLF